MSETPFTVGDEESQDSPVENPQASSLRILAILGMIGDPDQSLVEINKHIAMEIAHISSDMAINATDPTGTYKIRALSEQVKALRELSKTLVESEQLAKRDVLNFDGPKFQFVLSELVKLFKKTLQSNQMTESQINDILRGFRDLLATYDPVLRKETDRITGKA